MSLVLLLACAPGADTGAGPDTAPVVDPEAPVIESAEVVCYLHETGDRYYQWSALATVSDPQGKSTVDTFGTLAATAGTVELGDTPLACADGGCLTSWREGQELDVECANVDTYSFTFSVSDKDGHASAPLVVGASQTTEP